MAITFLPLLYFLTICRFLPFSTAIPFSASPRQAETNGFFPSYNYGFDPRIISKSQGMTNYPVIGALGGSGPNGTSPPRLEIRQLQQDTDQFTLYLLGLDIMQFMDQTEMLSWYQIAGIHGRPYLPWDGVQAAMGDEENGYCSHTSILFPPWHRPYLALFEQVLYGFIQLIATYYPAGPIQDKYVAAAANFRIPYWDWAVVPPSGESVLPASVAGSPSIRANGPFGTQIIANPLFRYVFKPLNTTELPNPPISQWNQTLRYPTSSGASATSQNNLVAQRLNQSSPSFRNRLYNLFVNCDNYTIFSNEAFLPGSRPNEYDSIESIHDQIHGLTGSGGHMSYIDYSAFDPIFFLHHAMVDRCFAMWQVLNPNSYVVPESASYPTFTTSAGDPQDADTPLTPFHANTVGDFWTSDKAQYPEIFGYTYAEIANPGGLTISQMQTAVTSAINTLYGSTDSTDNFGTPPKRRSLSNGESDTNLTVEEGEYATNSTYREWIANIRVRKHALAGPFFIHIFLGPFSPDPFSWSFEPNLVGTHCIYVRTAAAPAGSDKEVTATMPLTRSLLEKIKQGCPTSLEPQDVEAYMLANLKYRVTMLDDTEVPNDQVSDLKITVVSSLVQKAACETEFPVWGVFVEHFDVDGSV